MTKVTKDPYVLSEAAEASKDDPPSVPDRSSPSDDGGVATVVRCRKRLFVEDEAEEEQRPLKEHQTEFTMVSPERAAPAVSPKKQPFPGSQSQKPAIGLQYRRPSLEEESSDDSLDSFEDLFQVGYKVGQATPSNAQAQNMAVSSSANRNLGFCFYERLEGGVILFFAKKNEDGTGEFQFNLHALIGAKNGMDPFYKYRCMGVTLAKEPNSFDPITTVNRGQAYPCHGLLVLRTRDMTKYKVSTFFNDYIEFCNDFSFRDKKLVPSRNFIHFQAATRPDATRKPKRKLGDVAVLSDAINFCELCINSQIFDHTAYQYHKNFVTRYFNPPYPHHLHVVLGFPEG